MVLKRLKARGDEDDYKRALELIEVLYSKKEHEKYQYANNSSDIDKAVQEIKEALAKYRIEE